MKTVIGLYGPANTGKSATLKKVYELLKAKHPNAPVTHEIINHDVRAIININGHRIGFESHGDPVSRIFTSISMFAREECDLIVCATRTRGRTVVAVESLKPQYSIKWIPKIREPDEAQHEQINKALATDILKQIQLLIHA
jgi:Ni2+-binding GTPase involved in maturation of urease and hydrogenase